MNLVTSYGYYDGDDAYYIDEGDEVTDYPLNGESSDYYYENGQYDYYYDEKTQQDITEDSDKDQYQAGDSEISEAENDVVEDDVTNRSEKDVPLHNTNLIENYADLLPKS